MRTTLMMLAGLWITVKGGVPAGREDAAFGLLMIGLAWAVFWDVREGFYNHKK